jgi:signal peptidase I
VAVMRETRGSAPDPVIEPGKRIATPARAPVTTGRWAWEWIKSFLIALGLFLIIRTFVVEAFRIPTGSMERTLLVGDFLLVNKLAFGAAIPGTPARLPAFSAPARGDIIVFVPPHEAGKNYVKRLVGLPGDTLEMRRKTLYVNGRPQDEAWASHSDPGDIYVSAMFWQCAYTAAAGANCRPTRDNWGPLVVPAGHYFVLGDNRDDSEDSRYWGFVDPQAVKGRPLFIYFSYEAGSRTLPWLTAVRWDRIGSSVH